MSLQAIRNVVLLFKDPASINTPSHPHAASDTATTISPEFAYREDMTSNITTLSTNYASPHEGTIQGLLYVPDLLPEDPCNDLVQDLIPTNVTRQENLPGNEYKLIALAPWITVECTKSFMKAAATDPLHALLVYRPGDPDGQPPEADSLVWHLDDAGAWMLDIRYPVYAVPSNRGKNMMHQLSLYSGDMSTVPYADEINRTYSFEPDSYVRIWATLSVVVGSSPLSLWALVLIIIGILLFVIAGTSIFMHYAQSRRRAVLRYRVIGGQINLEALGIKRLVVPLSHIETFPLLKYNYKPPASSPTSSQCPTPATNISLPSSNNDLIIPQDPLDYQPLCSICLEDYEPDTTIRELPCGHIFHPECIDEYLSELSSLCPFCKASMLPPGYCPEITNSMVRKELSTRKLRSRGRSLGEVGIEWQHFFVARRQGHHHGRPRMPKLRGSDSSEPIITSTSIQLQDLAPAARKKETRTSAAVDKRKRMEQLVPPVDETSSSHGRSPWERAIRALFPGFG